MTDNLAISWLQERLSEREPLNAVDLTAINALPIAVKTYEPGQYLLREGDLPKTCSFLMKGFVFRHKVVGDGGRQIVSIHVPRDLIDIEQVLLKQADHNVQTLTAATVLTVPSDDLIAMVQQHPTIAISLWHEMLIEASILREWLANVGRRNARARTAHMLCELAVRSERAKLGHRETFELPMTQEQSGDALGLTAVHINRTLKLLENDGLIVRNKRSIVIADWQRLRDAGDFSSRYLHLDAPMPTKIDRPRLASV